MSAQELYEQESRRTNCLLGEYPNSLPTCKSIHYWSSKKSRKETKGRWPKRLVTMNQDLALERAEKLGLLRMKAKREAMKARKELKKQIQESEELERELNPYNQKEEPDFIGECGRESYRADFCIHCEREGKPCRPEAVADAEKEVISCSSESVVDAVERATVCMECGLDHVICICQPEPKKEDFVPPPPAEPAPIVDEEEEEVVEEGQVQIPYTGKRCDWEYKWTLMPGWSSCDSVQTFLNKEEKPRCAIHWDFVKDGIWPGGCDYSTGPAIVGGVQCRKTPTKVKKVIKLSLGVDNTGRPYCEEHWKKMMPNQPFKCDYFGLQRKNAFIEGDGKITLPPLAPVIGRRSHSFCVDCKRVYHARTVRCYRCQKPTVPATKDDASAAFKEVPTKVNWLMGGKRGFCEGCRVVKTMRKFDEEGKPERLCYICRQHPKPNTFSFIV